LCFPILSKIFSRLLPNINYNISYEYVVIPTCVQCMVLQVSNTEPSLHVAVENCECMYVCVSP
jgi:hypothetical protein